MNDGRIKSAPSVSPAHKALSTRVIVFVGVLLVFVAGASMVALILAFGSGTDVDRSRLDAIRTAGSMVVGTGGAVALLLAARRQRSIELEFIQKERAQSHVEHDAAERRVIELYSKAAEQLGNDKAPVRMAGLFALERLGQTIYEQRQTVINLLCAYLRMPYTPIEEVPGDDRDPSIVDSIAQEMHVRLTVQQILAKHLRYVEPAIREGVFWEDIDIDLSHAVLINFSLESCKVRDAIFGNTRFVRTIASFERAKFTGYASFTRAKMQGVAKFNDAQFDGRVSFRETTSDIGFEFSGARFLENVDLPGSTSDPDI